MAVKPEPPRCPYCHEDRDGAVEVDGYQGFCNTCGRTFAVPTPPKKSGGEPGT